MVIPREPLDLCLEAQICVLALRAQVPEAVVRSVPPLQECSDDV